MSTMSNVENVKCQECQMSRMSNCQQCQIVNQIVKLLKCQIVNQIVTISNVMYYQSVQINLAHRLCTDFQYFFLNASVVE